MKSVLLIIVKKTDILLCGALIVHANPYSEAFYEKEKYNLK